ncbi:Endopolyphosphatase [Entomortierella lignicola]|nr:Endopolyphosphatase [Entomortierella lignicola]
MEIAPWSDHDGQKSSIFHTSRCSRDRSSNCSEDKRSDTARRTRWLTNSSRLLVVCCLLTSLWHLPSTSNAAPQSSVRTDDPEKSFLLGQFLHITDIHPDEFYLNGGSISSSCHRNLMDDDDNNMLLLTRPGRTNGTGGYYGSPYSICDSPFTLTDATFDWISKELIDKIDFVVWTGDNARHDSDNEFPRTQQEIEDLNRRIANNFLETFKPDRDDPYQRRIPIVPSIGNNDVYPHNIMQAGPNRILQHFSDIWSEFIPEDQYHTFQNGGYYVIEVVPGKISVIALNTLYFFKSNAAVDGCYDEEEPGTSQMDWLEVELEAMRRRGMTAYLSGHVPPARKSYSPTCFVRYTSIALRYQDVIVGHLYGHANIDHFFILSQSTLTEEEKRLEEERNERKNNKNQRRITDSSFSDPYEFEFDQFHSLGLNSYLDELWEQYQDIPTRAKLNDYAIVLVSPSVIPTYNPSLRVYTYQLAVEKIGGSPMVVGPAKTLGESEDEDDYDFEIEMEGESGGIDFDDLKKKKPRKPRKPKNPPAAPPITFGFPLGYTQYWVNLTRSNLELTKPEYEVEYRSQEDWGLEDLSVSEWLGLAKRIVQDEKVKEQYLAWMVVLTGTENEHD